MPVKDTVVLKLTCPYCENPFDRRFSENGKQVVECWRSGADIGCSKKFVIDVGVTITFLTYKLELARVNAPSLLDPSGGGVGNQ